MIQRQLQHFSFGPTIRIPFCKGTYITKKSTPQWAPSRESCIFETSLQDLQQTSSSEIPPHQLLLQGKG